MQMKLAFKATLPMQMKRENGWYVACCPILDVFSQGKTVKQAKANLGDALYLFFTSCFERGTLDAVLKECGFTLEAMQGEPSPQQDLIDVPFELYASGSPSACHA